jgi:hypothetical protein
MSDRFTAESPSQLSIFRHIASLMALVSEPRAAARAADVVMRATPRGLGEAAHRYALRIKEEK